MANPADLRYATTHEWARADGDAVVVGITAFAIEQLTEPTYLELVPVGTALAAGGKIGVIESYKSTSDIYTPVAGTVVERNDPLTADPRPVYDDAFGAGWMLKLRPAPGATLDHLLTAEQYDQQLAAEGH